MKLISNSDWFPCGTNPEQIEKEAVEFSQLFGAEAVILHLTMNQQRLAIEWATIHRIASILKPGPYEIPPERADKNKQMYPPASPTVSSGGTHDDQG